MTAVVGILEGLELGEIPRLVVYNKSDLLSPEARSDLGSEVDSLLVSAVTGEGTEALVARIGEMLKERGKLYETRLRQPLSWGARLHPRLSFR
jgi:50S ribosomal subunit-associated GTPase HflX